jgi:hypothetical protein
MLLACVQKLTPVCGLPLRKLCQLLCHLLLARCLAILVICHGVPHAQHNLLHVFGTTQAGVTSNARTAMKPLHSKDLAAKIQAMVLHEGVTRAGRLIPGPYQTIELAAAPDQWMARQDM